MHVADHQPVAKPSKTPVFFVVDDSSAERPELLKTCSPHDSQEVRRFCVRKQHFFRFFAIEGPPSRESSLTNFLIPALATSDNNIVSTNVFPRNAT